MQTQQQALTALQKEPGLINYYSTEPFICLTVAEINIIVSLLSQQSEGVEEDIEAARKFRDYFYENLSEHHNPVISGFLAGCQHIRQSAGSPKDPADFGQLSQQEAAPIKLGDRFLTQEEFNRMYTHYSELCDKEDTNSWFENQFYMLKAQQQQGEWISVEKQAPERGQDVIFVVNNRILAGRYLGYEYGYHDFSIPGHSYEAEYWQPSPPPPTPQDPADNHK